VSVDETVVTSKSSASQELQPDGVLNWFILFARMQFCRKFWNRAQDGRGNATGARMVPDGKASARTRAADNRMSAMCDDS
jgi:hypothetical protein